jgi:hypothetical protein
MPIEIRELVIRATVDPSSNGKGVGNCAGGPGKQGDKGKGGAAGGAGAGAEADDDLVQSCVREVLRILEEKRER